MVDKKKHCESKDLWEIRGGMAGIESHIPCLGYSVATLKDMLKNGYSLYKNGKRVKLCDVQ